MENSTGSEPLDDFFEDPEHDQTQLSTRVVVWAVVLSLLVCLFWGIVIYQCTSA